jgi:hypothetical protein
MEYRASSTSYDPEITQTSEIERLTRMVVIRS